MLACMRDRRCVFRQQVNNRLTAFILVDFQVATNDDHRRDALDIVDRLQVVAAINVNQLDVILWTDADLPSSLSQPVREFLWSFESLDAWLAPRGMEEEDSAWSLIGEQGDTQKQERDDRSHVTLPIDQRALASANGY